MNKCLRDRFLSLTLVVCFALSAQPLTLAGYVQPDDFELYLPYSDFTIPAPSSGGGYSYIDTGYYPDSVNTSGSFCLNGSATLPSSYDSRDNACVTSVKTQGSYNTCWAHSAVAGMETSAINNLGYDTNINLSESHLAYFTYCRRTVTDPLGYLNGDNVQLKLNGTTLTTPQQLAQFGGNDEFASATLTAWLGMATEASAPYSNISYNIAPSGSTAFNGEARLKDIYFVSFADTNDIKALLMENGAASVGFYWADTRFDSSKNSYYYNSGTNSNHAVTLIGWDDNYSRLNFKSPYPSGNGAWLCKNSWDSSWGNNGYFWISYYDTSLTGYSNGSYTGYAAFYIAGAKEKYEHNYQYDGTLMTGGLNYGINNIYSANVFTASGEELLKAVGISNYYNSSVSYEIKIYTNLSSSYTSPAAGTLTATQTGTMEYSGFYTIPLTRAIKLSKGRVFSVVIKLTVPSGEVAYADVSVTNNLNIGSYTVSDTNAVLQKQSYISGDGSYWVDLKENVYSNRIKAFTSNAYPVTKGSTQNGNFAVTDGIGNISYASNSDVVYINTTPNSGYLVFDVTAVTPTGAVSISAVSSNNQYSFVMPANNVTVTTKFGVLISSSVQGADSPYEICPQTNCTITGVPSFSSSGNNYYGTGSKITATHKTTGAVTNYVAIINGDLNGDSTSDALDCLLADLMLTGKMDADGFQLLAADAGGSTIGIEDFQYIMNLAVGKAS